MPSAQRRRDQAEAGRIGVAGLQAVHGGIALQQPIAILLLDAVMLELAYRIVLIVLRIVANHGVGQQGQVAGGGVMLRRRQSRTVLEVSADHPQALGVGIHQLHEGLFGAGNAFGQSNGRVVTRLNDHPENQVLDRYGLAQFDEGARPFGAPGMLADIHLLFELEFYPPPAVGKRCRPSSAW